MISRFGGNDSEFAEDVAWVKEAQDELAALPLMMLSSTTPDFKMNNRSPGSPGM